MEQLIINLLGPIFTGMGASMSDVETYIHNCIGFIYAILIGLVIMAVVIVVASLKARKGWKMPVNVTAVVAWLLAVLIIVNMVCLGPLKDNINLMLSDSSGLTEETIANSKAVIEEIGQEGMVLVENNGLLPLSCDVTKLNVFGWGSTNPIFGGTGSGSSDGSTAIGILQSLANAGYTTNADLTKLYTDYRADRPSVAMQEQDWTLPEPTADAYTDAVISQATGFSDVAVVVLSRSGGEGADLPTDMYAVIHGTYNVAPQVSVTNFGYFNGKYTNNGNYDDFDQGEHYLEPSNTEEAMIDIVCQNFDKVILVINANNAMELGWVKDHPQIGAVILAPGTGATGFNALGKIIKGEVNPSGRTVDTYVYDLTDTPTFNNIGGHYYNNVSDLQNQLKEIDGAYEGALSFVNYVEGIYVGYKFYETANDVGMEGFNYDEKVVYPFGYGLSYTTFTQEITNFDASGDTIKMSVKVTNTGSVAGKDVVEIYSTPPYTEGGIEKASVNLVDFGKTELLEAGKDQTIDFEIPKEDLASYDYAGVKVPGGGYVLEAGEYTISIRSDSHTVLDSETFTVDSDVTGRASDKTVATNLFGYAQGTVNYLSRAGKFANYAEVTAAPADSAYVMDDATLEAVKGNSAAGWDPTKFDNSGDQMPTTGASNGLKLADLRGVPYDDAKWDQLLDQMSVEDMITLVNRGGFGTQAIESVGKIATTDCDGPAGVNLFFGGLSGTAYPSEVLMAQTWNKELATKLGDAMGHEYKDLSIFGWYGPAMNTHRNAFAGRNFEYFSEDGVLAGKFCSNQVNAASKLGVYAYIKHFALNDQETNRCAFLLTYSNEQAIREIYLKPFEIVVKNFDFASYNPLAVMSSFNWIGTKPAGACGELLNSVLRGEWGFVGMVITDFDGSYGYMITENAVRNGNDMKLGFGSSVTSVVNDTSATQVLALRNASKNILYTVANSGHYAPDAAGAGMDAATKLMLPIDIGVGIALAAILVLVWLPKFLKKKK